MSAPVAAFVSYRLGGADGVGVEAAKWEWALHELGFDTRRIAGEMEGAFRADDTWLPFLAIDPVPGARIDESSLAAALAGADLVVVENLCSLPLNVGAANATRDVLAVHRGRVCFHHHDLPWERPHLARITDFPPRRPDSLHVTISEHARSQLAERGIGAFAIPNSFDFDAFAGDGPAARATLGFGHDELLLVQPTRAIPRKNIAGGLRFAGELAQRLPDQQIRYWITGPAEDGFDAELERLVAQSPVSVRIGRAPRAVDAYAAADLVVFPSTWEGFGNPVVESVAARRMIAVASYPVLDEIAAGLELLSIDDPDGAAAWLRRDAAERDAVLEANARSARARFSIEHLPERIGSVFAAVGWTDW